MFQGGFSRKGKRFLMVGWMVQTNGRMARECS